MRHSSPTFALSIPAFLLLTAGLGGPVAAGEIAAEKQAILSEMENVAEQMAMQREQAPDGDGQDVEAGFRQMTDHGARQLELEFGASDSQVQSFREQARAIGREHGLFD